MDATQREKFERDGYVVVPGALSTQQLAELNAVYDERIQDVSGAGTDKDKVRFYIGERPSSEITDRHNNRYTGRRFWSQAYRDLVDNSVMMPILREILGDRTYCHAAPNMPEILGPQIRLDHDNGVPTIVVILILPLPRQERSSLHLARCVHVAAQCTTNHRLT
jgi:hypothetical protein